MIEEGRPAPELELTSDSGETVSLSSLLGKPAVLCFYPKEEIADENEMNAYGMDGPSPKALTEGRGGRAAGEFAWKTRRPTPQGLRRSSGGGLCAGSRDASSLRRAPVRRSFGGPEDDPLEWGARAIQG